MLLTAFSFDRVILRINRWEATHRSKSLEKHLIKMKVSDVSSESLSFVMVAEVSLLVKFV